jgi:hypothetical protein
MTCRPLALGLLLLAGCTAAPDPAPAPGTIAGAPFTPLDGAGFLMEPVACAPLGAGFHAVAWVQLSSVGGICSLAETQGFCAERAGAVTVTLAIARNDVDGDPVAPIGPGTYASSTQGQVDANGVVLHFWASAARSGPDCAPLSGPKEGGVGTIVLDEVGPSRLRGSAAVTFDDGSFFSGPFDVPVCGAPDAAFCASLKGGCTSRTCVP